MKSNQINSSEQPPAMSASSPRENPCIGHDANAAAFAVRTDDGISYLLPYAQFLYAKRTANPALEKDRRHHRKKCPFILRVPTWSFWEAVSTGWNAGFSDTN